MKILVVGSGGREHTICWKLKQSPNVSTLFCAPGNAGIEQIAEIVPLKVHELDALAQFARKEHVDLTIVGPEQSLALGIVDLFEKNGMVIFGPTRSAAQLETSKVFAKDFMVRHRIPTARHGCFGTTDELKAHHFINELAPPIVVKADGLAAGKGVIICQTKQDAEKAVREMTNDKIFGTAGERIVIEEFMTGEEASLLVITDGKRCASLAAAQDHKRIFDGDKGKNTGGMGAYAPAPVVDKPMLDRIWREIVLPTIEGMRSEGIPFRGCLYVGLMITSSGPKVVEFNCRFGDPESQVVLPLIDGDLSEILYSAATHRLNPDTIRQHAATAVCVVMASQGYPDDYEVGKKIMGLEKIQAEDGVVVFHAGTKRSGDDIITSGGRVLGVTAIGYQHALEETVRSAYSAVDKITFDGAYFRRDIGQKALRTRH